VLHQLRKFLLITSVPFLLVLSKTGQAINYDVELIIFENVTNTSVGSSPTNLFPVINQTRQIPVEADPNAPLQPLPQLRLTEDAEKIRQSGNHRLLYHGGWRQTDFDRENAPFMSIALGERQRLFVETGDADSEYLRAYRQPPQRINPNTGPGQNSRLGQNSGLNQNTRLNQNTGLSQSTGLDQSTGLNQSTGLAIPTTPNNIHKLFGGVKVWVGRFLHFDTKLVYTPTNSDASFKFESERRMRSRQMHYIDHSRVGILVKIFPVDETAEN